MFPIQQARRWRARRRRLRRLAAAIARLPARERAVYQLCAMECMPYADVAEVLGLPTGEVVAHLTNALVAIAAMLDETSPPAMASDNAYR